MKEVVIRPKTQPITVIYLDEIESVENPYFGMLGLNGKDKSMLTNFENNYFWVGNWNMFNSHKYTYSCIIHACNPRTAGAKVFKFESGEELMKWMSE